MRRTKAILLGSLAVVAAFAATTMPASAQQQNRPNIVMLMTDDTGWNDFGAYSGGGAALGHPTPNVDRIAKEGAVLHQLVRPSELHRRPRFVHHRAHSDPLGALDRGCSRRRKPPAQGNADDRRILSEERILDLLLRQVASRRQAGRLSQSSTASTR